jgi:hypothetical protein
MNTKYTSSLLWLVFGVVFWLPSNSQAWSTNPPIGIFGARAPDGICDDSNRCVNGNGSNENAVEMVSTSIVRQGLDINTGKLNEVIGALGALSSKLDTLTSENKTLRDNIESYSHKQVDDLRKFINNRFDQMPSAITADPDFKKQLDDLKKDIINEVVDKRIQK